jgi:hypothetical protein
VNRRLALALALALAGCGSSGIPASPVRLEQPSAVAVFRGLADKNPTALHPYVAVANARRGDLTLIDAVDDKPVLAPVLVRSLAVPVPDARPTLLVASSLWDGDDVDVEPAPDPLPEATPDLLVVVSEGIPVLRLVKTWGPLPDVRVLDDAADDRSVDLGALAPGAEVVALAAAPVPDAQVPPRKTAGRVRVVAALTGARLGVIEYARGPADGEIVVADAWVQPLEAGGAPFQGVALAVSARDPAHLYVASPDPIGGVLGVAELDMTAARGAWTARGLDARAPTRLVAAARLRERKRDGTGEPIVPAAGSPAGTAWGSFEADEVDRVYAVLDETACGPTQRIGCGLAVIDPVAGGLRADYTGEAPYLAPIAIPGFPTAITIALPPARAPAPTPAFIQPPFMKIAPGTGTRGTTAVAAVASGDGRVYFVDLPRWAIPSDRSILYTGTRTAPISASSIGIASSERALALWGGTAEEPEIRVDTSGMVAAVKVTPGFTTDERWTVTFQGVLPGLLQRLAEARLHTDGRTRLALQVGVAQPGGGRTLTQVVRVFDPALGIRPGDVVRLLPLGTPACSETIAAEALVAEILPPAPEHPGGALVLDAALEDPRPVTDEDRRDWPACVAAVGAAGAEGIRVEVRARGLVVTGSNLGYVGRPEIVYAPSDPPPEGFSPARFELRYEDEDAIACPLVPWPADPFSISCDEDCRRACERLVIARKARRTYHLSETCSSPDLNVLAQCRETWADYLPVPGAPEDVNVFPYANGPVVSFALAYLPETGDGGGGTATPDPGGLLPADDPTKWGELRSLRLDIVTQDGVEPAYRAPLAGTGAAPALPTSIATFDRSPFPGKEVDSYRFYVAYAHDFVLDFTPSQPISTPLVIR